jgi:lambda family phage portal protein
MTLREVPRITLTTLERLGAAVDAAISVVAPRWGLARLQARAHTKLLSTYRGAEKSRLRGDWKALNGSADADLLGDLPSLRQRSRDLNRNDAHANAITGTVVANVVGTGLKPQSRPDAEALEITPKEATTFARQAERAWRRWCPTADSQNRMDFYEIQALVKRQTLENGEVFVLPLMITDEPGRRYRLALEVIEADRVSTPPEQTTNRSIRDGIELGDRGQPIAYYIRKKHPGDILLGQAGVAGTQDWVRYPAVNAAGRKNVLHLYPVKRPGQTRGEPYFAPVLSAFKDLGDMFEAEIVAGRVAACFAAFVTKSDPYGVIQGNTNIDAAGRKLDSLEPGMIEYLNAGETVTFGDPKRPSGTFAPFVEAVLRSIGSSLGLPLELVLKDFSKTNYSSARAALLEARRYFRADQTWLASRLCQPCWEWVLEEAWLREYLPAVDLLGEPREDWMRVSWIAPGWGWVDPVKEVESSKIAIEAGLSTLADECGAQGRDWEDVMVQRKREDDRRKELGLAAPAATPSGPGRPAEEPEEQPATQPATEPADDYAGAEA